MSSYGSEPSSPADPYGPPAYGGPQAYGQGHGQPAQAYGQPPQAYGQGHGQPYGQTYGQGYGGYGGYGGPPVRPGGVVTAAVLGFVWGALGVLVTILLFVGGVFLGSNSDDAEDVLPGLGDALGTAAGIFVFFALLALAWTVVMIWGSAWAVSGRSRVMLLVGGSIAIGATLLLTIGGIGSVEDEGPGGLLMGLVGLVGSILIVVLLSTARSSAWFAAERARRPR
ncbi:hypothetical protein [Blastococcus sp. TF02A-26]|uniref:hypothetical protein n=1 Tax=Blastococcus sp. TF02A-26 TaxID=2250577 RepID=UPI000DE8A61C|nr:hypothetical protein [Blastococcus sp. TF02A-26]RBY82255.1 hypothetical protein DQ240_19395 [Blastococcus sp. TF02A-26]